MNQTIQTVHLVLKSVCQPAEHTAVKDSWNRKRTSITRTFIPPTPHTGSSDSYLQLVQTVVETLEEHPAKQLQEADTWKVVHSPRSGK